MRKPEGTARGHLMNSVEVWSCPSQPQPPLLLGLKVFLKCSSVVKLDDEANRHSVPHCGHWGHVTSSSCHWWKPWGLVESLGKAVSWDRFITNDRGTEVTHVSLLRCAKTTVNACSLLQGPFKCTSSCQFCSRYWKNAGCLQLVPHLT